jgi:hypothetical protein
MSRLYFVNFSLISCSKLRSLCCTFGSSHFHLKLYIVFSIVARLQAGWSGIWNRKDKHFSLLYKILGPILLRKHQGSLPGESGWGLVLATRFHLGPMPRMSGTSPASLYCVPTWRGCGQLCFSFIFVTHKLWQWQENYSYHERNTSGFLYINKILMAHTDVTDGSQGLRPVVHNVANRELNFYIKYVHFTSRLVPQIAFLSRTLWDT